jgi:hypothetical protein
VALPSSDEILTMEELYSFLQSNTRRRFDPMSPSSCMVACAINAKYNADVASVSPIVIVIRYNGRAIQYQASEWNSRFQSDAMYVAKASYKTHRITGKQALELVYNSLPKQSITE